MTAESVKEIIKRELPELLRSDPSFRDYVLQLTHQRHPTRGETEDWFHAALGELRRDREANERRWEEQKLKDEQKWEEQRLRDEQKWEEQRLRDEQKWEEQRLKDEKYQAEQSVRWEESNRRFDRMHEAIMEQNKKFDRSIGALGARWGMQSERAFRNALAGILEKHFGVEVINVNEFDDEGVVFGRPDQIELDIIIKNGVLLICELKSSIDKAGMYVFERKARFYEALHQRQAQRLIVISPMVDAKARKVAQQLGIEVYYDSTEVESLDTQ